MQNLIIPAEVETHNELICPAFTATELQFNLNFSASLRRVLEMDIKQTVIEVESIRKAVTYYYRRHTTD